MIDTLKKVEEAREEARLSGSMYDKLKFIVEVVLPGFATLYFALATIWGLPAAEQVVATLAAVAAFLGLFLRFSNWSYQGEEEFDGDAVITVREDGSQTISLELDGDPATIKDMHRVAFKVRTQ